MMALPGTSAIKLGLQIWQIINLSPVCFFVTGLYSSMSGFPVKYYA